MRILWNEDGTGQSLCARQRDEAPARGVLTRRGPVSYGGMRVATSEIYHAAEGRFPIRRNVSGDAHARTRMTSSLATVGRPIRSLAAAILIALPGCGVSPSVNILGSFFPAWLISIVIGVVLTVVVRQLFVAIDVASHLRPAGLVYPCLGGLLILATWLILFGS